MVSLWRIYKAVLEDAGTPVYSLCSRYPEFDYLWPRTLRSHWKKHQAELSWKQQEPTSHLPLAACHCKDTGENSCKMEQAQERRLMAIPCGRQENLYRFLLFVCLFTYIISFISRKCVKEISLSHFADEETKAPKVPCTKS